MFYSCTSALHFLTLTNNQPHLSYDICIKPDTDTADGVQRKVVDYFPSPPGPRQKMYMHQPMLRSNLSAMDVVIEGIGEIDARLQTVGLWVNKYKSPRAGSEERPYHRGVIYYLRGDKVQKPYDLYMTT